MTARGYCSLAGLLLALDATLTFAYPSFTWSFETLAKAPVIATCIVRETTPDSLPAGSGDRVLPAHAVLQVIRSFPPNAIAAGSRIRLDYEAHPEGKMHLSGPDLPYLTPGDVLVFPLKSNSDPLSAAWRLIGDEGRSIVVPALARNPAFGTLPEDGRTFLLQEIASTLAAGTRRDLLAEASFTSEQAIASELMHLLESKLADRDDRWPMIAAAFLSSFGVPRPSVADFRAGRFQDGGHVGGSLMTALLQKMGTSQAAKEHLIHHLLVNSDIASWGVGVTLPEFSKEPSLIRELRNMLRARSPGALSVASTILRTGQKEISPDALALSFYYLATPATPSAEVQVACRVIRDFGTDEQFGRFMREIRNTQYHDPHRYDALWASILWSDNKRESQVLNILLKDDRMYRAPLRYSDVARGELTRMQAAKP